MNALVQFYADDPDATMIQAGETTGVSRQTVSIYLSELEQAGRIERNGHGVANLLPAIPLAWLLSTILTVWREKAYTKCSSRKN